MSLFSRVVTAASLWVHLLAINLVSARAILREGVDTASVDPVSFHIGSASCIRSACSECAACLILACLLTCAAQAWHQ